MYKRAFTFVELLVVVAIIGILSTIVLGNLGDSKAKSRDAKRVSDIAQIQLALAGFYDKCGEYPYGNQDSDNDGYPDVGVGPLSVDDFCPSDPNVVMGNFIHRIPNDPVTDIPYSYIVILSSSNNNPGAYDYHLAARLETQGVALKDRAGFNSTATADFAIGFDLDGNIAYGLDATADPLIYDVRPGL